MISLNTGFWPLQSKNVSIKLMNHHKIKGADLLCSTVTMPPGGMRGPLDLTLTRLTQQGLV